MPQVRCPRCGTTITLENRKETDFSLILNALHNGARSFSELLRTTGLPRKTLNNRLKELHTLDAIAKNKGYFLNEANPHKEWEKKLMYGNSRILTNNKKALILLLLLCIGTPATFAFARFFQSPLAKPELRTNAEPLGYLTTIIKTNNVSDVYGWQIGLRFNSTNLRIMSITPGSFLTEEKTIITYNVDHPENETTYVETGTFFSWGLTGPEKNVLLVGQSLLGRHDMGVSGSGDLAHIRFSYLYTYEQPELVFNESPQYDTMLLRMDTTEIPLQQNTVTMHCLP